MKEIIDKLDFHKIKNFCPGKDNAKRIRRQATYWETIFAKDMGDGIPVELFQILKDDAVKVLHSICQQIWKTQQWPQD